jgi:hypothetical protein
MTRRELLLAAAGAAAGLVLPRGAWGRAVPGPGAARYATQPSWQLPAITVDTPAAGVPRGPIATAPFALGSSKEPNGPLLVDDAGEPVWYLPLRHVQVQNLKVQRFRGKPVLTWYEGTPGGLYGGSYVIYDSSYRELKRVHAGHGLACDLHEFLLTDKGTALLAAAASVPDPAGGPPIVEGVVQERDVDSGRILLEWHSLGHVPVAESYRADVTPAGNVDYFHLNSIEVDADGNLLVSARHTSTVYKLDRKSGAVLWRLGGKRSDFTFGPGASFSFQHDARRQGDGTLTLFDNGATGTGVEQDEPWSRPIRLAVDIAARKASLVREYVPTQQRLAVAMGNLQVLPDGGVFVGWGTASGYTEFGPDGSVRLDATFPAGTASYRALRSPWVGRPSTKPAVVLQRAGSRLTALVSWNGATEVASWRLRGGTKAGALAVLARSPRTGFETVLSVDPAPRLLAVEALDARGRVLGRTRTIALG